jgi:peptidoglycan/LPS O-acetylase OafA/YrhL
MRIKYIDGMRGLAVLMVLFSHLIVAFYPVLYPAPSLSNYSLNELLEQPLLVKIFVFTPLNIMALLTF